MWGSVSIRFSSLGRPPALPDPLGRGRVGVAWGEIRLCLITAGRSDGDVWSWLVGGSFRRRRQFTWSSPLGSAPTSGLTVVATLMIRSVAVGNSPGRPLWGRPRPLV